VWVCVAGGNGQRPHDPAVLSSQSQRCSARGEDRHVRTRIEYVHNDGGGTNKVFKVVQHEQPCLAAQRRDELVSRGNPGCCGRAKRLEDRPGDHPRISDTAEVNKDRTVTETLGGYGRHSQRQARLPDPARSRERDQPHVVAQQQRADVTDLPLATDQRVGCIGRLVVLPPTVRNGGNLDGRPSTSS
jgi:hypothetical protein